MKAILLIKFFVRKKNKAVNEGEGKINLSPRFSFKGFFEMLENKFKTKLVKEIKERLPGCMIMHPDPNEVQGIPDLLILYEDKWAALEGKKDATSSHRPNQDYYVEKMNDMSYAAFIYPENKEEILNELQQSLQTDR